NSVVIDRVLSFDGVLGEVDCQRAACLRIGFIERRPGAGNRDTNPMASVEDLTDPADIECELVDLAGFEQGFVVESFAIAGAPGIVANQDRATVGINIANTNNEIGIASRRRNIEASPNTAGPFHRLAQRLRRKGADLRMLLQWPGILGARGASSCNLHRMKWVARESRRALVCRRANRG